LEDGYVFWYWDEVEGASAVEESVLQKIDHAFEQEEGKMRIACKDMLDNQKRISHIDLMSSSLTPNLYPLAQTDIALFLAEHPKSL
jgi:hypothetical protein